MKRIEAELLVIGAGLAGTASALSASKAGKKVLVLFSDGGATAMSSGALDLADDLLALPRKPELWCLQIEQNLEQILLRNPEHPYHLLGDSREKILEQIKKALELIFPDASFLQGNLVQNEVAFNQLGTFKPTAFYQKNILIMSQLHGIEEIAVINFLELKDFDAKFFQKNFEYWGSRFGAKFKLSSINLKLGFETNKSCLEIAKLLEETPEPIMEKIILSLKEIPVQVLLLPPVLPGKKQDFICQMIEQETKCKVRELLAFPPSVPGKRLQEYLTSSLRNAGVNLIYGKAVGFKKDGKKLMALQVKSLGEELEIFAQNFILATGGFLGGGLIKRGEFQETIFGLPLFHQGQMLGKIFTEKLTHLKITEPHPVFSVGIKTDSDQRPLGSDGKVVFENLFTAGSILSGANYIFDGTGAGVAISTGWNAGKKVAK